jgi:hypothetical protein
LVIPAVDFYYVSFALAEHGQQFLSRGDAGIPIGNDQDTVLEFLEETLKGEVNTALVGPNRFTVLKLTVLAAIVNAF